MCIKRHVIKKSWFIFKTVKYNIYSEENNQKNTLKQFQREMCTYKYFLLLTFDTQNTFVATTYIYFTF